MFPLIVSLFFAFLLSLIVIFWLRGFSLRKRVLLADNGVPVTAGLGFGLVFVLVTAVGLKLAGIFSSEAKGVMLASSFMLLWGVIDDLKELSIASKFFVQIISAVLLAILGVRTFIVGIGELMNIIITIFWVLTITNAFNHLDILDGLAAAVAFFSCLSLALIAVLGKQLQPAFLAMTAAACVAAFLFFNLPPAKVYMGNAGSHFLGFLLASIALLISYAPLERRMALATPIFILGVPILDTAFLALMRLHKKISPFSKSNDHIAMRLLAKGYSKKKALFCLVLWVVFFSLGAVVINQAPNKIGLAVAVFLILVSIFWLKGLSKIKTND